MHIDLSRKVSSLLAVPSMNAGGKGWVEPLYSLAQQFPGRRSVSFHHVISTQPSLHDVLDSRFNLGAVVFYPVQRTRMQTKLKSKLVELADLFQLPQYRVQITHGCRTRNIPAQTQLLFTQNRQYTDV